MGETCHKSHDETPPQRSFGPTHLCYLPPVRFVRPVISLRGNVHRQDQSHFLRPRKVVLEGSRYSTSPSPKSHDLFSPRLLSPKWSAISEIQSMRSCQCRHASFRIGFVTQPDHVGPGRLCHPRLGKWHVSCVFRSRDVRELYME